MPFFRPLSRLRSRPSAEAAKGASEPAYEPAPKSLPEDCPRRLGCLAANTLYSAAQAPQGEATSAEDLRGQAFDVLIEVTDSVRQRGGPCSDACELIKAIEHAVAPSTGNK